MEFVLLRRKNTPHRIVAFLPRAAAGGQRKLWIAGADRFLERHVHKCPKQGALLVTESVDHNVVSLIVFMSFIWI